MLTEPRPRSIRDALHEVAGALPDHLAIDDGARAVTFTELVAETERVALAVRAQGSDPTAPVLVVVEQGTDALVAIIGVTVSGRIAAPVDSRDPLPRLEAVHRAAGASLIVCDRASAGIARAISPGTPVITPDDVPAAAAIEDFRLDPESLCHLYFTSGSTGVPKGILRNHHTAVHAALRYAYTAGLGPSDRIGVAGSLAFSGVHWNVWSGLLNGLAVHYYDLRERGVRGVPDWLNRDGVTATWFVPSVVRALVDAVPNASMPSVRTVLFSGETAYGSDVQRARRLFSSDTAFRNSFASTETMHVASWLVPADADDPDDGPLPLGRPEPWAELHVVDGDGNDVPVGEPGTLVAIGDHISLGYWRDPERTASAFFDLPDGRRGFRTGDGVRRRSDGVFEYLGRRDDQVKVRGASVSPSDVERALAELDDVADAVVDTTPDPRGTGTRLVGYVVPQGDAAPSGWQLRHELAGRVPSHMVPGVIVVLDGLPLGPRGKVDRSALPPPPDVHGRPYREPVGRERDLAQLYEQVLGVERIGLDDDFFELGGDSLAAIELLATIDEQFGVSVPAPVLLEAPTVAQLARRLVRRRARDAPCAVALRQDGSGTPLFCATGGGSPATTLRALAGALAPRPVYGLQARGLEERARPDRSVEAFARRYLRDVRDIQPNGPYLLAGHSFGALVAFEMACRLEAVGEQVAQLVLIDMTAPGATPAAPEPPPRQSVRGLAQRRFELATAGLVARRLRQYRVFFLLSQRLVRRYRPRSTFQGPALVVRAAVDSSDLPRPPERDLGWSRWIAGPRDAVEVPGDHVGVMREPYVRDLGGHIARALDGT
ncbi:MAG TPA: AMP-binding protein [Acidimicrobiia bacterium]|nr:AMP-binding protein [Acidimicrobiia bacterium]